MKAFKETKQMNKEQVEQVITAYAKPIYGFALKRCVSLQDAEERIIRQDMKKYGGNLTMVAKALNISRPTLYGRLKKYGI